MSQDSERAARWQIRAEEYRARAAACVEPGARAAYLALAKSCDGLVDYFAGAKAAALAVAALPGVAASPSEKDLRD